MNETPVITTRSLTKRFGTVVAVEDLTLTVHAGEIYGFLGLNGAGKTTTISMLLGLIRPTAGSVQILGTAVQPGGTGPWEHVGSIVETPAAYPELSVRQNLEVFRRLRGIEDRTAVDRAIEALGLVPYADRQARHLSLGNHQRLGIAKALLHHPRLLILDEPSNGLDPAGIVEVRELLRSLVRDRGVTVFVSSHILDEVSRLATRVGIIHHGRLLKEVSSSELGVLLNKRLMVTTRDDARARSILSASGYKTSEDPSRQIELREERALEHPELIAELLVKEGVPPTALWQAQETLESFFLRSTADAGGGR